MKQVELERKLARQEHLTRAEARDTLDEMVREVLESLRQGEPAEVPGAGRLCSDNASGKTAHAKKKTTEAK